MFKRILLTAAVTAALVATTANARPPQMGQLKEVFKQLELNDDQKQDVRTLMKQGRSDRALYRDDMKELMAEMKTLIQASEWDEAAVLETVQARQSLLAETGYQQAVNKQQLWQILDADQQAEFETLMGEMRPEATERKRDPLKRLDLSDEQATQIEAVKAQAKATAEEIKPQLKAFKQAETELIKNGELSQAAWQTLAQQYQDSFTQMALNKAYARHQVWNLLDEEQQQKAESMMGKARKFMGKRFARGPEII